MQEDATCRAEMLKAESWVGIILRGLCLFAISSLNLCTVSSFRVVVYQGSTAQDYLIVLPKMAIPTQVNG